MNFDEKEIEGIVSEEFENRILDFVGDSKKLFPVNIIAIDVPGAKELLKYIESKNGITYGSFSEDSDIVSALINKEIYGGLIGSSGLVQKIIYDGEMQKEFTSVISANTRKKFFDKDINKDPKKYETVMLIPRDLSQISESVVNYLDEETYLYERCNGFFVMDVNKKDLYRLASSELFENIRLVE
ncbi:hypothetical protein K9L97_04335 [Candidatus Woesearchaeota archaeon]|nr:hypothetical protein [Candidatus Woesearchaeota archaeon]